MKYFRKKLLGHEVFRSMVSWATKLFLKNLKKTRQPPPPPSPPPTYLMYAPLVEIYIYFRVIYLVDSYHRLRFSIVESYVYYEFIKL